MPERNCKKRNSNNEIKPLWNKSGVFKLKILTNQMKMIRRRGVVGRVPAFHPGSPVSIPGKV